MCRYSPIWVSVLCQTPCTIYYCKMFVFLSSDSLNVYMDSTGYCICMAKKLMSFGD